MAEDRKQAIAETFDAVSSSYGVTRPDFLWPLGRRLVASAGIRAGDAGRADRIAAMSPPVNRISARFAHARRP